MLITGMSLTEIPSLNMLVAFYLSGCVTRPVWYRLILARPEPPVQYPPSWSSQSWGQQTGIAQEPKQLGSCGSDSTSQHWDNRACLERDKSCQLMSHLILGSWFQGLVDCALGCRVSKSFAGSNVSYEAHSFGSALETRLKDARDVLTSLKFTSWIHNSKKKGK